MEQLNGAGIWKVDFLTDYATDVELGIVSSNIHRW